MKMQESVLKRVRMLEAKHGIKYAKTDGALYRTLRVAYTVVFAYTMAINLLFILGMLLTHTGENEFNATLKNSLITVAVSTLIIIGGYCLGFSRFKLISGIVSVIPEALLIAVFGVLMRDSLGFLGFTPSFYWRHAVPLALLVLLISATTAIAVRARHKTEKQYKKVMNNLYSIYSVGTNDITDEQWEAFLRDYDPTDYKKLFKAAEQAQKAESE